MLFILFVWFVTFLIFRCEKFFFCKNFLIACQSNKITLIANRNNIGKLFCNTDNENHHAIEISSIFVNTKKVITVFLWFSFFLFCVGFNTQVSWRSVLVQFWWRSSFCVLKLPHLFFFFFFPTTTMIYYLFMYDLYSGNQMVVVTNQQKVTSLILFNSFVL